MALKPFNIFSQRRYKDLTLEISRRWSGVRNDATKARKSNGNDFGNSLLFDAHNVIMFLISIRNNTTGVLLTCSTRRKPSFMGLWSSWCTWGFLGRIMETPLQWCSTSTKCSWFLKHFLAKSEMKFKALYDFLKQSVFFCSKWSQKQCLLQRSFAWRSMTTYNLK